MRLIDADALLEDVRKHSESYFADDFAEYWVDRQPTIAPSAQPDLSSYSDKLWRAAYERGKAEAQPRRLRGRWVETERRGVLAGAKYYKCDICAQPIVVVDSTPMNDGYNYCPRCGSQMEEGQDGQN